MLAMHTRPLNSWSATFRKRSRARGTSLMGIKRRGREGEQEV
jgi:hypothetical protein